MPEDEVHELKAIECLLGAESEFASGRHNNAANRAYYACFHGAIVALIRAGVRRPAWSHDEVRALFAGQLVRRRKLYPAAARSVLAELGTTRLAADYQLGSVSRVKMERELRRAIYFIREVLNLGN